MKGNFELIVINKIFGFVFLEIIFLMFLGLLLEFMMILGKRIGKLVKKFMRGVLEYGSLWVNI